jgi:hypothetical protein
LNTRENVDVEAVLARSVLSYLANSEVESEPQRLREVCSALTRFLGLQLPGHKSWSKYYWVDDILPTSATALSGELKVQGLMVWGQSSRAMSGLSLSLLLFLWERNKAARLSHIK